MINYSQHGFTKGRSCLTNLLSSYRKAYETEDNDDNYDIIYLDFSKAFYKVPHDRLLSKFADDSKIGRIIRSESDVKNLVKG